ncbi:MAG: hypothetical protein WC373_15505, partial [Smithella sp.]
MKLFKIKPALITISACIFLLLIAALPGIGAEIDDSLGKCAIIQDDAARLNCFDELAQKKIPA